MPHVSNGQTTRAAKTAETGDSDTLDSGGGSGLGGAGRTGALVSAAVDNYDAAISRLKARFLKAHIRRHKGQWVCEAHGVVGYGPTPAAAYFHWNSKTRPLQQYWMPAQPIQWPRNDAPWLPPYTVTCGVAA